MKTKILILLTSLICDLQLSGQTIPENVTLKQLDGKEITFKEAVQQGPVIVSFWATWCKPCQSELEALKDLEDSWKNKVRIIAVSIDDARAMAKVKSLVKATCKARRLSKYCSTRTKSYIKHSIFQQFPMF